MDERIGVAGFGAKSRASEPRLCQPAGLTFGAAEFSSFGGSVRVERKLAAILMADVVGYSRLMGVDEAGTLTALRSRRTEIIEPLIVEHHGRVVKLMGDGFLVEFASAVNAVECALAVQKAMQAANREVPEDRRLVL